MDEALRLSGKASLTEALEFFMKHGTGAVLVTNGAKNVNLVSDKESIFYKSEFAEMPVSAAITTELNKGHIGDTTGCGDNFAGGGYRKSGIATPERQCNFKPEGSLYLGNYFRRFFMLLYGGNLFSGYTGRETKINDPFF
jgi:hypothetical protein